MARTLNICTYAILFLLITSIKFPITEGRQIKKMKKQEVAAIREHSEKRMSSDIGNLHQNNEAENVESSQPAAAPTPIILSDHQSLAEKPEPSPGVSQISSSASSETTSAYDQHDFGPTTPGISLGVGHPLEFADIDSKVSATYSSINHFISGQDDEFHSTKPGHSRGVGHIFQTKNAEPKE